MAYYRTPHDVTALPAWQALKLHRADMQHFSMREPLFKDGHGDTAADDSMLDELSKQIKELIDKRVRPAVAMDGGDIVFDRFDQGIFLSLQVRIFHKYF